MCGDGGGCGDDDDDDGGGSDGDNRDKFWLHSVT